MEQEELKKEIDVLLKEGNKFYNDKRYDDAEKKYKDALNLQQDSREVLHKLALVYLAMDKFELLYKIFPKIKNIDNGFLNERIEDWKKNLKKKIRKAKNQNELLELINSEIPTSIKKIALQSVDDINILTNIALNNNAWTVQIEAVQKIDDNKMLFEIINSVKNDYVRNTAIEKIDDYEVLSKLLENDISGDLQKEIIKSMMACRNLPDDLPDNIKEEKEKIYKKNEKSVNQFKKIRPRLSFFAWGFSGGFYYGGKELPGKFLGTVGTALFILGFLKPIFSKNKFDSEIIIGSLILSIVLIAVGYSIYLKSHEEEIEKRKNIK